MTDHIRITNQLRICHSMHRIRRLRESLRLSANSSSTDLDSKTRVTRGKAISTNSWMRVHLTKGRTKSTPGDEEDS